MKPGGLSEGTVLRERGVGDSGGAWLCWCQTGPGGAEVKCVCLNLQQCLLWGRVQGHTEL